MSFYPTPSQTVGPFFHLGFDWLNTDALAAGDERGERVTIEGRVLDGDGRPVPDAVLEIWQANADGKYAQPENRRDEPNAAGFRGFGRIPTDDNGMFRFTTIKPGRVPGPGDSLQAPHLAVSLAMRGLLKRLVTRIYFPDEPGNADDPILALVEPGRRATLVARKARARAGVLEWNVILQGSDETVFFDC